MIVSNMLVKLACEDDEILFAASVKALMPIVDKMVFLDTTPSGGTSVNNILSHLTAGTPHFAGGVLLRDAEIIDRDGFAAARNEMLKETPMGAHVLWVDSDEVHFPFEFASIKEFLGRNPQYNVQTHFIHFCLGSNAYERFEPRVNIFKKTAEIMWENRVHEKLNFEGPIYHSPYFYHHYGYVRPQEFVFGRWHQYALLEGQKNPYKEEECEGEIVPYFRGTRDSPSKILEDRRERLIPYFGLYPETLPQEWILNHQIRL
jgi:hypothetical protein